MVLRILAFVLLITGALGVYSARWLVERFDLEKNVKIDFDNNMDSDEMANFKTTKAIVNIKMLGMLVMLPGLILLIIAFR